MDIGTDLMQAILRHTNKPHVGAFRPQVLFIHACISTPPVGIRATHRGLSLLAPSTHPGARDRHCHSSILILGRTAEVRMHLRIRTCVCTYLYTCKNKLSRFLSRVAWQPTTCPRFYIGNPLSSQILNRSLSKSSTLRTVCSVDLVNT